MFLWSLYVLSLLHLSSTCSVPDQLCPSLKAVQDEIVHIHNTFRREVVPTASNMLKMKWNEEVAASAQKWADTCAMAHGPTTSRMLGSYEMGENLFKTSQALPWTDVVRAWHNEVANYNYSTGSINGKVVGHYTQLSIARDDDCFIRMRRNADGPQGPPHTRATESPAVATQTTWLSCYGLSGLVIWFSSYEVGCGVTKCGNNYFYDCQYYRAGNYKGVPPYSLGEPCSACPQACDNKLCTNPCPYINIFTNCPTLTKQSSCNSYLKEWCTAQCFCPTEIIPTN